MVGHKAELFVLDLSFIGLALLTAIPFVTVWVTPYMEVTFANYYLALLGLENQHNGSAYTTDHDQEMPPWEL